MKKKALSVLLASAMVVSLLAGCSKAEETAEAPAAEESSEAVEAGEIPADYVYYYSFDEAAGTDGIQPTSQTIGGDPILAAADKDVVFLPGVKGEAVYSDGITGYKLTDVNGVGDNYTVSFWLYATRFANYMPTVQFGPDVHGDATGNQHYLNITRAEWAGEGTFPCVWAYDQADNELWPAYSDINTGEPLKQWINIAITVDSNDVSADGTMLNAKLYINGQEWVQTDADGNVVPVNVVNGCMASSDNFDFLLGVNYWDSIFKGAFDELYIYDYALDASQIAALYADGDPTVAYEEPERVVTVVSDENAIEKIGAMDFSNDESTSFSSAYPIGDGETWQVKMKNWSDGTDVKNNYTIDFQDDNVDLARVNADMSGYYGSDASNPMEDSCFEWSWGNWTTWEEQVMVEADVTLNITRDGTKITVDADDVDYNKTSNTATATFEINSLEPDSPLYFMILNQHCYTEILSVKNMTANTDGVVVGSTDRTTAWWTEFSDIFAIPEGESVTKTFTNYTDGVNNWDNFVVILQNTPDGHSADDNADYAEYAVVRADNYGWGAGYEGIATADCDWNWDTFTSDMDGATCEVTFTNNGATADITAVVTTADGTVYNQSYTGIATDGDLYACFSCEASYLVFQAETVGSTDRTTAWWTEFSDIWEVPEGETLNKTFVNYTDGVNNWDNFVVILQNTPGGHSADDNADYAEYAVVRADNYGWGAGYEGIATADCDWNWDTFTSDMDGATVNLSVTNNGKTADIKAVVTTADGKEYNQSYTGIATDGDLYMCLSCEAAYLLIQ